MGCPFRAVECFFVVVWMFGGRFPDSQGVALGYDSLPLQGEEGGRFGSFCGTASLLGRLKTCYQSRLIGAATP
ncbi:MAG: hypothetical protein UZ07_CHB004000914 [Chlorobi bacterium OLB7]|nr:MAG: hypothetical protein UZ07_CHB004000914 [Chlorobi bacterium OLB7]